MAVKPMIFRIILLCFLFVFGCASCAPTTEQSSYSAIPTGPTFTPAFPTATVYIQPDWSSTPALGLFVLPTSREEQPVWSPTPGLLEPPTVTATPTETSTVVIIFNTPLPGQVQGIRGRVLISGGPANEAGLPAISTPYGESGHEILVKKAGLPDVVARTVSHPGGNYSVNLLPGMYDVCVNSEYSECIQRVMVTAGEYVTVDLGIAMP